MVIKECVVCGKEFDAKRNVKSCSEECKKQNKKRYHQQYYQGNKEHLQRYQKKYYQDNKEHVLQQTKQYYQDNKEHVLQQTKQYYQKNKEKVLEYQYQRKKKEISKLIKQYDGDLDKILEKIPTQWHLREAQMQVWFNESYYDGIIAKKKSTPCCEVTGKTDNLVVHHLYSFNTHPELGNDPANMVRVHKDIHKEFHNKYGRGNNTPEQWEEFIKDYNKKITTLDDFGGFE